MKLNVNLSAHARAQLSRFVRLFATAFFATGVLTSGNLTKAAVAGAVVGALETAYRQAFPVA